REFCRRSRPGRLRDHAIMTWSAMTIELTPALQSLIQQRLQSGAFENVEQVLLDALRTQQEREEWLQANKEAIDAKVGRAIAQLDSGEGIAGEQLRDRLEARKSTFLSDPANSQ